MIDYGFKKEEIIKRRIALKKLLKNNSFCDEEKKEIFNTLEVCDNILLLLDNGKNDEIEDEITDATNAELINEIKDYVNCNDFDFEHAYVRSKLCRVLDLETSKSKQFLEYDNEIKYTNNEVIEIVGDMIKSKLGRHHYNIYKRLFVNNPSHVHFIKNYNSAIYLPSNKEDIYAFIEDLDDISKISNLAHEAGHFFSYSYTGKCTSSVCLGEVESTFYELLLCDYLIEENIYPRDAKKSISEVLLGITEKASIVNAEFSYPMYRLNSVRDFKDMANKYDLYNKTGKHTTRDLLTWITLNNEENQFDYIYSTLIALEFYDDYLKSKNKKNVVTKYESFLNEIDKVNDFRLASYISKDYITFNNFKTLKKYREKYKTT